MGSDLASAYTASNKQPLPEKGPAIRDHIIARIFLYAFEFLSIPVHIATHNNTSGDHARIQK